MCFRNKQTFWYALYDATVEQYDEYGNQIGTSASHGKPVQTSGNISPARGNVVARQFGDDEQYDKEIVLGDRDTPIDEYTVLWIDTVPELDSEGALKVNADGEIVTPWDYIVRRVARGLPNFGSTRLAVSKVTVA
jgi:hypothetical protein